MKEENIKKTNSFLDAQDFCKNLDIREIFRISIFFKWIVASLQIIGGLLILLLSRNMISKAIVLITNGELIEDPRDYIATNFIHTFSNLTLGTKFIIAFYLIIHGCVNFYLLYNLWKDNIHVYLVSATIFMMFLLYQIYRFSFNHSIWLFILCIIDAIVISLILHEYKALRDKKRR